jgi:hypothetical protein
MIAACGGDIDRVTAPPVTPDPPAAPQPSIRFLILDSTQLSFVGTAEERAAGRYVFRVVGTLPAIGLGDYVAGKQGGLFMGRVLSMSRSSDVLTLKLARTPWSEVLKPYSVHVPFTPGAGSAPTPYGQVRWGPWRLVDRQGNPLRTPRFLKMGNGLAPNAINFDPRDFSLEDVDICEIAGIGTCQISGRIIHSHFSLDGSLDHDFSGDLGSIIPPELPSLSMELSVSPEVEASLEFQLSGSGEIDADIPLVFGISRSVTVGTFFGDVTGSVSVGLILNITANVEGTIQPFVAAAQQVTARVNASTDDGISFHFSKQSQFDAGVKLVELGDVGLKVSVGPEISASLDFPGGDMGVSARADGFLEGTETRKGPADNPNWYVRTDAGIEASIEGHIDIDLFDLHESGDERFPGPELDLVELWGTGDLRITTATTGQDVLPSQVYAASVARAQPGDVPEAPAWSTVLTGSLGINASRQFAGGTLCRRFFGNTSIQFPGVPSGPQDCDLAGAAHTVDLSGIAWNCAADEPLPALVQVRFRHPFDATARLTTRNLGIVCRSAFVVVREQIDALFASGAIGFNVANALRVKLTSAETARDAGDAVTANSVMGAFSNLVSAQAGKHITAEAAAELQAFETLLKQCYLTLVPTCSAVPGASVAAGAAH